MAKFKLLRCFFSVQNICQLRSCASMRDTTPFKIERFVLQYSFLFCIRSITFVFFFCYIITFNKHLLADLEDEFLSICFTD